MLYTTISFQGNCDEALTFYKETLGAEIKDVAYFRDAPPDSGLDASLPPNFVMHSEVSIFGAKMTMTDGATAPITGDYFSLMLSFDSTEEVTAVFNKLADGGQVVNPLASQFWATLCGDVQDRFGIHWHIFTSEQVS
ncbi:MAG: VOC family protein [Defluviitaleaceae bacterium]|nr:VOC family protein [Defluviitaleaceae bacterium]